MRPELLPMHNHVSCGRNCFGLMSRLEQGVTKDFSKGGSYGRALECSVGVLSVVQCP